MKVSLFSFVHLYAQGLDTLANILQKGAAYAASAGVSEAEMLDWRLAPDMFPLRRQAQIVTSFAKQWPARAAGLSVPGLSRARAAFPSLWRRSRRRRLT